MFKEKLFYVYEDIIYKLAVLSLILWILSLVMPQVMASFFRAAGNSSDTTEGSIFVYTMMQLSRIDDSGILRNAGFAWEPGRFACFLCLGIFCNFLINGYRLNKNYRLLVLVATLLTTQSTTGMFTLLALALLFILNKKFSGKVFWVAVLIPAFVYLYGFDFVSEKAERRLEEQKEIQHYGTTDAYALDRVESAIIEWDNLKHDPILGYGEWQYSAFTQRVGLGYYANNGTMTLLAKYGLLGLLCYFCIFLSSKRMALFFGDKVPCGYLILYIFMGMGYDFNQIVLVLAFSFWGIFLPEYTLTFQLKKIKNRQL